MPMLLSNAADVSLFLQTGVGRLIYHSPVPLNREGAWRRLEILSKSPSRAILRAFSKHL